MDTILKKVRIRALRLSEPARVGPQTSLEDTIQAMRQSTIGCALISEGHTLIGILTERDVLNKIVGSRVDLHSPVREFMTPSPGTLRPEDTLAQALRLMTEKGYRHIPLVDGDGNDAGIVCAKDLVEYIAEHFPAEVVNLPPRLHQVTRKPEGG
ncbi:MAG TPA: CBS domain-containing protein [Candidatus Polarisedimenticolia bacterium]|jgi:CBS domain-containing protein|nr:CBS domain-containing protein [Candidatus Polarisedimenticolia bacterium]